MCPIPGIFDSITDIFNCVYQPIGCICFCILNPCASIIPCTFNPLSCFFKCSGEANIISPIFNDITQGFKEFSSSFKEIDNSVFVCPFSDVFACIFEPFADRFNYDIFDIVPYSSPKVTCVIPCIIEPFDAVFDSVNDSNIVCPMVNSCTCSFEPFAGGINCRIDRFACVLNCLFSPVSDVVSGIHDRFASVLKCISNVFHCLIPPGSPKLSISIDLG